MTGASAGCLYLSELLILCRMLLNACKLRSVMSQVARTTGLLLEPIYSLAAWEVAVQQAEALAAAKNNTAGRVCMLHCGGMHGLHGLAQRFPAEF